MPIAEPRAASSDRPWWVTLALAVTFLVLAVALTLIRFRNSPVYPRLNDVNSDLFVYQVAGNSWVQGLLPYGDVYDVKGPFLYLLFGLFAHIRPWSMAPPLAALIVLTFASLWLSYAIARRYLRQRPCAALAAVVSGLAIYLSPAGVSTSFSCEELAVPGVLLLLWLVIRWLRDREAVGAGWWVLDGIAFGALFWSKYLVIAPWLAMLVALAVVVVRGEASARALLRVVVLHLLGAVIATAVILPFYAADLSAMTGAYFLAKSPNVDLARELSAEARFAGAIFTANTAVAALLLAVFAVLMFRTTRDVGRERLALMIAFALSLWASGAFVRHPNNLFVPLSFVAAAVPPVLAVGLARGRAGGVVVVAVVVGVVATACVAPVVQSVTLYGLLQPVRLLTCYNLSTSEQTTSRVGVSTVFAAAAERHPILSIGNLSSARSDYISHLPADRPFQFVDASWSSNIGADRVQTTYVQDRTFDDVWIRIPGVDKFHNLPKQIAAATYTNGPSQAALAAALVANYTPVVGCNNEILLRAR